MGKKIKILLVEDEVLISECLNYDLREVGFETFPFIASGEEAIMAVKEEIPDIILMDIHLAGEIDGIEAAEEILNSKKIPIIFMTGYEKNEIIQRTNKMKEVIFLEKPVEIYDITRMIEKVLK